MNAAGGAELIARARALVPALRERAPRAMAERRVPPQTIEEFQRAGFFRVLQPKRFGGMELDFATFARLVRELAHGCASSAWVYAVIGELGWVMAMFPEEGQKEVWEKDPSALGCAAVDPSGQAEIVSGGFRLSGKWRFVSGSDHAQWVMLTAPAGAGTATTIRQFLVRRAELGEIDDWHVLGLAATGSKTLSADNVFVPAHRSIMQQDMLDGTCVGATVHPNSPTYRSPRRYLTAFSLSPVLVGLAERAFEIALDTFRKQAAAQRNDLGHDALRHRLAHSAADIETIRLIFDQSIDQAVARLAAGEIISAIDVRRNRMMAAQMVRLARETVDNLCGALGSGWLFDGHPLSAVFRDATAGATHRAMNFQTLAGDYLDGLARHSA